MRDYGIQFNSDNSATFSGSIGRVNEINAVRLVITLNEELADEAVDCYMLCFDTSAGLENPIKICRRSDIIDGSGSDYYEDGVIYFTVPGELTANKKLGLQVEAHVLDEMGEIERLIKSQVITLELDGSVEGDDSFSEEAADGIVLRIYDAIADANSAAAALSQAQLDGEFNGANGASGADGASAYEVAVSNGFTGTEHEWLASLVGSPIPVVTSLPSNAQENDFCVLKNEVVRYRQSTIPSGTKRLWFNTIFPNYAQENDRMRLDFYNGDDCVLTIESQSYQQFEGQGAIIQWSSDDYVGEITWTNDNLPTFEGVNYLVFSDARYSTAVPDHIDLPEYTRVTICNHTGYVGLENQNLIQLLPNYTYELYCFSKSWIKVFDDVTNESIGGTGADGASAYEVAVANGYIGTEPQWLASLVGATGATGARGAKGDKGDMGDAGTNGVDGADGQDGTDGASAYEIAVTNGFTGTEPQWLASLVGSPIPVVTALSESAQTNDLCILKSTKTHTPIANIPVGTKRLWINPDFPHDLAVAPNNFEINFYSGAELISGIGAFTAVIPGYDTNTIIGFGNDGDEITWDGDGAPTYRDSNGTIHTQIPAYIELPEFTSSVVTSDTDYAGFDEQHLLYPEPFYKYELYYFNRIWIKVVADSADIADAVTDTHTHTNKKTLDKLYCEADESTGVISGSTASGYIAHNTNGYLRYCTDGAVINGVTTITRDGTTYLRLAFNKEPVNISDVPDYVDIPISTVTTVEETNANGITTNAAEVDFGVGDAVTNEHTHENKTLLDGISEATNGTVTILKSGNRAVCELPSYIFGASTHNGVIYAGFNTFSSTALTTLTITSFSNPFLLFNPEYNFTFISGSTAATLNLPASVVWGGGNELVVEANKKYEISIRDNVALWTSTDLEVI